MRGKVYSGSFTLYAENRSTKLHKLTEHWNSFLTE